MTSASMAGTGAFVLGWLGVLRRHSYAVLCLAVLPMVAWRVVTGVWEADFWEHAAVIDELAKRPFGPLHPMLGIDAPHALNSPYHLALGMVSRLTGASAISVLAAASIANFAIFCVAFRLFVRLFTRRTLAPFLALLFTLLLWGPEPWEWSGFYHLRSFSNVMPYPSTLATAAAFLAMWASRAWLLSGRPAWVVATALLGWLVLLMHPATFAFAAVGMAALAVRYRSRLIRRRAVTLGALIGVAALVALAWPYYSLLELPGSDRAGYLRDNDDLLTLSGVLLRVAPALIGLPFLALRFLRDRRDPLVFIFVGVAAIYIAARVGQLGSMAPTVRFVVLVLHVAAAGGIARLLDQAAWRGTRRGSGALVIGAAIGLVLATATAPGRAMAGLVRDETPDLAFLAGAVPDEAIVMADSLTALEVPAWGPNVIAWHYAMPFVQDRDARRTAVDEFYAAGTPESARRAILARYCVEWVLVVPDRLERVGGASAAELIGSDPAAVTTTDDGIMLAPVAQDATCSPPGRPPD